LRAAASRKIVEGLRASDRTLFADVAVDIAPKAVVAAQEAAQLVQTVRAPAHLVTYDEFDGRVIGVGFGEGFDL
jgi:hypothetical protein